MLDPTPNPPPTIVTVMATHGPVESGTVVPGTVVPGNAPIEIRVIHPAVVIGIRVLKVYFQTLTGLIAAGAVTDVIPYTTFFDLVWISAGLSIASAGICLFTNITELLTRLDQKYPSLTS